MEFWLKRSKLCCLMVLISLAPQVRALAHSSNAQTLQSLYTQLQSAEHDRKATDSQRRFLITKKYDELFSSLQAPQKISSATNNQLTILFQAAYSATFYSYESRYLQHMQLDLHELERRKAATQFEQSEMFSALVQLRQLGEAGIFQSKHPGMRADSLPNIRDELQSSRQERAAYFISPDTKSLTLRTVPASELQIVVIGHPLCHFTQHAVQAIQHDPQLLSVFKRYAVWIAPQDGELDFDDFQRWDREHPDEQMAIAYKESGWPKIDDWETPTFYFFKAGTLVAKVVGWPSGGHRAELINAMDKAGMFR